MARPRIPAIGHFFRADRPSTEVEQRWGGPPSRFVVVDGLRVHYRDQGAGPAIVLLHGSYSSLHTWDGWTRVLSSKYRVVTLDLPGHGLTGPDIKGRYSPVDMAELVHALASTLHVQRYVVAGSSMGGRVAAELALRHGESVIGLVLVDAEGLSRTRPKPLAVRAFESGAADVVTRWVSPRFALRRGLRDSYGDPSKVTEALVDRYEDLILREGNREAIRRSLGRHWRYDLEVRLAGICVPTLILWGRRDRWVPVDDAARFGAGISRSRAVVYDALGHMPMEEEPVQTAEEASRFLDSIREPARSR